MSNSPKSPAWNGRVPRAGLRTYTGEPVSEATAKEWQRLSDLAAKAKHPAARAYLIDQRARLLRKKTP